MFLSKIARLRHGETGSEGTLLRGREPFISSNRHDEPERGGPLEPVLDDDLTIEQNAMKHD
jgi:hypothetical protein